MRRFAQRWVSSTRDVENLANEFAEAGNVLKVKELIEPLLPPDPQTAAGSSHKEELQLSLRGASRGASGASGASGGPGPLVKPFRFNLVLKALANAGDLPGAERWFQRMQRSSVRPSGRSFGKLLKCAAKAGEAPLAERWLNRQQLCGFQVLR